MGKKERMFVDLSYLCALCIPAVPVVLFLHPAWTTLQMMVFLSLHDLPNRKRFESSIKDQKEKRRGRKQERRSRKGHDLKKSLSPYRFRWSTLLFTATETQIPTWWRLLNGNTSNPDNCGATQEILRLDALLPPHDSFRKVPEMLYWSIKLMTVRDCIRTSCGFVCYIQCLLPHDTAHSY